MYRDDPFCTLNPTAQQRALQLRNIKPVAKTKASAKVKAKATPAKEEQKDTENAKAPRKGKAAEPASSGPPPKKTKKWDFWKWHSPVAFVWSKWGANSSPFSWRLRGSTARVNKRLTCTCTCTYGIFSWSGDRKSYVNKSVDRWIWSFFSYTTIRFPKRSSMMVEG